MVALACSLALHEIVAGVIPPFLSQPEPEREVVQNVAIVQVRAAPTPTPTPKPSPTPPPVLAVAKNNALPTIAPPVPQPEGKAAHKEAIVRQGAARPKPPRSIHATPDAQPVPTAGQGAGAGANAGAGSLGNGTNGNGTGLQGSGTGGGGAPCGAVDFVAKGDAAYDPQTGGYTRDNVQAIVHYADGTARTVDLDWTWRFKSEADDPFKNASAPMYFQFPPPSQRADEPPVVQYIMRYSSAAGKTKLNDQCPNIPPPGTPQP